MIPCSSVTVISEYTCTIRFLYPAIFKRGPLAKSEGTILFSPSNLAMSLYLSGRVPGILDRIWLPISIMASRAWCRSKKTILKLSLTSLNVSIGIPLNRSRLFSDSSISRSSFSSFSLLRGRWFVIFLKEAPRYIDDALVQSPYILWQSVLHSWHEKPDQFHRGFYHA